MNIRTRIFSGFGVIVSVSSALALFGLWQLAAVRTNVSSLATVSENAVRNLEIAQNLEQMRRLALRYKTSPDDDTFNQFVAVEAQAEERLSYLVSISTLPDRRQTYGAFLGDVREYRQNFDRLAALSRKIVQEQQKLFAGGSVIVAANAKLLDVARAADQPGSTARARAARDAESAAQSARTVMWRFLATHDPQSTGTFRTNTDKAVAMLDELDQDAPDALRAAIASLKTALVDNAASFASISSLLEEADHLFADTMQPQVEAILDKSAKIKTLQLGTVERTRAGTDQLLSSTTLLQKLMAAAALVLSSMLAWAIGRALSRPVIAMTGAMQALAAGDMSVEIPARARRDEIGQMAAAVEVFKQTMADANRLRADQEASKARAETDKKAAMNKMADEFEAGVKDIVRMVSAAASELQTTAQSLTTTAEETQRQSTAVAAASEQASANVQTVATAAEELASSIAEISRQVAESTKIADQAVTGAEQTNLQVQALADAAQKIGDVVKLINDIAGQTNLLALNATIEAARAGDAGKGFAVVASEVKSLALQTAKATDDIAAQINAIQSATRDSVQAIRTIGQTIGRMSEIATAIASAVEEQGAATMEIARNIQQASTGTAEVSSNIIGVNKAAGETGASSAQVLQAASALSKQSETLSVQVDGFVAKVRAA
ncbi:MAG: methyl-accepting chemotaxis protein [Alphaproteobacteria bacterium]|nr:methyl-accepting chemotaxis protein [Alphaproteobacteria bacterium]